MTKFKRFIAGAIVVPAIGIGSLAMASDYKVQPGDSLWKISQKFNVSLSSLMQANNKSNSLIYPGQELKIYSVANVSGVEQKPQGTNLIEEVKVESPEKPLIVETMAQPESTPTSKFGEYIEWKDAQNVIPRGSDFKVIDYYTGESFMLRRSVGTNHADVETLTAEDTKIVKRLWGGNFSWVRRPVIVESQGRRLAASLAAMPHAGNENEAGGKTVAWRSLDYGRGVNLDYVKGNDMHGVMDLHFLGSVGHANPTPNKDHQNAVKVAAGLK